MSNTTLLTPNGYHDSRSLADFAAGDISRTVTKPEDVAPLRVSRSAPAMDAGAMSGRIADYLKASRLPTPFLVVDGAIISAKLAELRRELPEAELFYAVKANPLRDVLELVAAVDGGCDVASAAEIRMCLAAGIAPERMSFGNTIKRAEDIAFAHELGIEMYSADSEEEIEKLARHAPGAKVFVRLLTQGESAEWPLSRKFGCDLAMARELLLLARDRGLRPHGVSFHVGSQQTDPHQWEAPIADCAWLFTGLAEEGIALQAINLGGGFPAHYTKAIPPVAEYARAIRESLQRHFGGKFPQLMIEPGRCLVAEAGVIQTEILLVSRKSRADTQRWVFIDCGKFGGLIETMDEAIRYPLVAPQRGPGRSLAIIAGPTCDSADILYERTPYELPDDLRCGDRMQILAAGAYTYAYSSVRFNGFGPLRTIFL